MNSLRDIKHINIDRYVSTTSNADDVSGRYGFCYASKVAYCDAIYIRVIFSSSVVTSLRTAKCRLVPNKGLTIPRLELLACLLLFSNINTVIEYISIIKIIMLIIRCY